MTDRADLQISDLDLSLEPGPPSAPLRPVVRRLRLRLTAEGFRKVVEAGVATAGGRAPVDVCLTGCCLVPGGAEVSARAKKSVFSADLTARVAAAIVGGKELRLELAGIDAPRWVPVDSLLDQALRRTVRTGIRPDPTNPRAMLVDPALLVATSGLQAGLVPGTWVLAVTPDGLDLAFTEDEGA